MKHGLIFLALIIVQLATAQDSDRHNNQLFKDVKISLEMGSFEDIEILDSEDLISIFDYAKPDQPIELKIICNFDHEIDNLKISGTTMTIKGNTRNLDEFTRKAERVQSALKKLYKQ
ncbi:MAG: hypothetical protein HKO90_07080 [Flavobacteriaceae bacterium]|nr:hypothetical protein [Flavobacteriaceae bacterium]